MHTSVKNAICKTRIQTPVKLSSGKKFKWPVQFIVRKESGDDEAGLVPQASLVHEGLRDHRGLKVLKEIRDLLDLKAIKALKDPRAILANPSQLLLLRHLWYLWW